MGKVMQKQFAKFGEILVEKMYKISLQSED